MDLPIDARQRPIKAKYLDSETELLRGWFIFGEHPDGTVDIADGQQDVMICIPRDEAERIVTARSNFVNEILSVFCKP